MDKKAMSQAMYIVISLVVMLVVAVLVLAIANDGITGGGGKMIDIITGTDIPVIVIE
ncbi:MAG: hypothetical protein KAT91_02005 [Candidatus Aenigmarchaeota archaeon]|nr:hypothetical protein [Candidatus Aenigmarchaeota archaeon]